MEEQGEHEVPVDTVQEAQLSWAGGSVRLRTQCAYSLHHCAFPRQDLAVGIVFALEPVCEPNWLIGGDLTTHKVPIVLSRDLIVVPPGHEFEAQCRSAGQGLWIFIDPRTMAGDEGVRSLAEHVRIDASWMRDRLLATMVAEIRRECLNGFPRGQVFLERAALIFVTQLAYFLDCPEPQFKPAPLSDGKLQIVLDYFERNLNRNIALSEVSDLVDLTPRYFCAAFKKATGRSPHQFQIELRVERAKALLNNPNLSLVDIALMVGFSSQSHLSDCFRRIQGVTPARYRAEIRAAHLLENPIGIAGSQELKFAHAEFKLLEEVLPGRTQA